MDVTAPQIAASLTPEAERKIGPGGVEYFIAPASVTPAITASDVCDPQPTVEAFLDGQAYVLGTPITAIGVHSLQLVASDRSGNKAYLSRLFEIRNRANHAAIAVVEDFQCIAAGNGLEAVSGTILLASDQFDVRDVNLATVALWLVNESGRWMNAEPITMNADADAEFELVPCFWRLNFTADVSQQNLSGCPVALHLTGSGLHGGQPSAFDFLAQTPNIVVANATQHLIEIGVIGDCDDPPPPPPPPPPCQWVTQIIQGLPHTLSDWHSTPCGGYAIYLTADWKSIYGSASAEDGCWSWPIDSSVAGAVASGGVVNVFLDPPNCCSPCQISIVAQPTFIASASIDPEASAAAGGPISIATPCGNTAASGGVAIGNYDTEVIIINGIPIPVSSGKLPVSQAFQGNLSCVTPYCSVSISIATNAFLQCAANATWLNWYAEAQASVGNSSLGLTINPTCDGAEPVGPIVIDLLPLP